MIIQFKLPWYLKNNKNPKLKREGRDESDMRAFGWTVGFTDEKAEINDDVDGYYLDLEYYRGDYKGLQRLLPVLVAHDKGEIDTWEYNILWQRIVAEHQAEKYKKRGVFETEKNKKIKSNYEKKIIGNCGEV